MATNSDNSDINEPIEDRLSRIEKTLEELKRNNIISTARQLREKRVEQLKLNISDKSLTINEAEFQKAVEIAQIFADQEYRDCKIWTVTIYREVVCVSLDLLNSEQNVTSLDLDFAAYRNRKTIEIESQNRQILFNLEEAEAIVEKLLKERNS